MAVHIDHRDILLVIDSQKVVGVLPVGAQDSVIANLRERGYYTLPGPRGGYAGQSGHIGGSLDAGRFGGKPLISHELSEDEEETIQMVLKLVHEKGKRLHLVDVGKESALRRLIEKHLHHLRGFPVLLRPDGRRLEGIAEFTPENVAKFLSD